MQALLECVPCVLNQIIKVLRKKVKNRAKRERILLKVLAQLSKIPPNSTTPPGLTHYGYEILRKYLGSQDFYKEEKELSNTQALKLLPELKAIIKKSKDPLHDATLLAIAGNIIDYGPDHKFDVNKTIKKVLKTKISSKHFDSFRSKLKKAKNLLYICDNAGEILFDKLFMEYLLSKHKIKITAAVKSKPVLNDAMLPDANAIGLDQIAKVIESGSITAGTEVEKTSKKFQQVYKYADLVIAKGQGNFETLPHNEKTFFLLMVKCTHLALATGLKYGEIVIWGKK